MMMRKGRGPPGPGARAFSWVPALFSWALFSALTIFIITGFRDRARLIRDNENERIFNTLFASFRNYASFDEALQSNQLLSERIAGFALYGQDLSPIYRWGNAPPVFDEGILKESGGGNRFGRYTIPGRKGRSVLFVLQAERMFPPPPPDREGGRHRRMMPDSPGSFMWNTAGGVKYFYIDIAHENYWRTRTVTAVLGPLFCLILLGMVLYFRSLYIRNIEYRQRIEDQKNLVVLGTAAGTLAHEIKNPLSSIKLQTGILKKILPGTAEEELGIIDEEVDRLSSLVYRINDYLREGGGNPAPLNPLEVLRETGRRLCGRDLVTEDSAGEALILADRERLRSILENLIRNAMESGGPEEAIGASVTQNGGLRITVFDRGSGIAAEDLDRVFDPFFTRKSAGTGIGLSISRRFAEAAGGSIELTNRPGGGTLAVVTFPLFRPDR
jgi:two-component system sensor histidine kinase HydH